MSLSTRLAILPVAAGWAALAPAQSRVDTQVQKPASAGTSAVLGPCIPGSTSMLIDLDGSFTVVTFDGPGGNGDAVPSDPCQRNDDDVTLAVPLSFTFDLFGQSFNSLFINNNGNVSFGASFDTFTSTGFPVNNFPMVAPFWADVDTRALTSGVVYYRSEANRFTVIWDRVGYYNAHADKTCTFELIITDGTDPLIGLGNNVAFCYDDMQWTTGDASGGSGGFGGTAATVGCNLGNGADFFQIGRFGVAGSAYDGPGGATDGVDFLDNTCYTFSVGGQVNVPPIFVNPPAACLEVKLGSTLNFSIEAIGPESIQTVTLSHDGGSLANFSSVETPGNPGSSDCTFTPDCSQVGQHQLIFTATDNFNPPAINQITVCIDVTLSAPEPFCAGDTIGDCPCGNVGASGNGCANSAFPGGANLSASGDPCLTGDTVGFVATGVRPSTLALLFQGTLDTGGNPVNDGNICVGGTVKRLWVWKNQFASTLAAPGNATTIPDSTGVTVSQRSSQLGDTIPSGSMRTYQVWYRDPPSFGCPSPATSNYSSGVKILWVD